ncbi:hypothetical protein NC652_028796 [Populus alba x Populus x berolinensis]|nr:hypothetical protein NC652_028796 [Populus alba x Populus x berolinensis]
MGWLSSVSGLLGLLLSLHCKVQTNLGSPAHEDMLRAHSQRERGEKEGELRFWCLNLDAIEYFAFYSSGKYSLSMSICTGQAFSFKIHAPISTFRF